MTLTLIIILILAGLLFIILEAFVFPGTTFVGIIGFILIGTGIWGVFDIYGNALGYLSLGSTTVLTVIGFYIFFKSKSWNKISLNTSIDSKVNVLDDKIKIGDEGKTVSTLNPMGKAYINQNFYEVRSTGEFVDTDTKIVITKIKNNAIYVEQKK